MCRRAGLWLRPTWAPPKHTSTKLVRMRGYGHRTLVEIVVGSTVDEVLRASRLPVLICH